MKLLILLGLFAAANAISFLDVSKEEWSNFKVSRTFLFFLRGKKSTWEMTTRFYYDVVFTSRLSTILVTKLAEITLESDRKIPNLLPT